MRYQTDNTRIIGKQEILSAEDLIETFPLSEKVSKLVYESRFFKSKTCSWDNLFSYNFNWFVFFIFFYRPERLDEL